MSVLREIPKFFAVLLGIAMPGTALATSPAGLCDINQDAIVNILDVQSMANEALKLAPANDDLDRNGVADATDVGIVAYAFVTGKCLATASRAYWLPSPYVSVENTTSPVAGGSQTYVLTSPYISVENTTSPLVGGTQTYVLTSPYVSVENTTSPLVSGTQTYLLTSPYISIENTTSPAVGGTQTYVLMGPYISVENIAPPPVTTPRTYEVAGLVFSVYNGPNPPSASSRMAPSLRFLVPVDPTLLAEVLRRGWQNMSGKANCLDTDGDGICDADELAIGTSPYLADTDGDGYPDGLELALGSDPLDAKSVPEVHPEGYYATPPFSMRNVIPLAILTPKRQGELYASNLR